MPAIARDERTSSEVQQYPQVRCNPHEQRLCDKSALREESPRNGCAAGLKEYPESSPAKSSVTIPLHVFADKPRPVYKAGM